ncbi:MAG: twin-arginine translocase TatA/TatE family subunit, partial [Anaerolineae bacterium]
ELILIFIIALLIFGPGKLSEVGRALGKSVREFRQMSQQITAEMTRELEAATEEAAEKEASKKKETENQEPSEKSVDGA